MRPQHATDTRDWPEPAEVLNERGRSPVVLVCEHASNHIPSEYDGLGLDAKMLDDHIAWDIGAAALTRALSRKLDAVAFLGTFSRLLIDLNRPVHVATSVPERSEATDIPGNCALDAAETLRRVRHIFNPFHACVQSCLDERQIAGIPTMLVSIHSFTPVYHDVPRPWHAGVLFNRSIAAGEAIARHLAQDPRIDVGCNVPYEVDAESDYCIPVHGEARGLAAVLIEVRNDGLRSPRGVDDWADRLAAAIAALHPEHMTLAR